MEFRDKKLTRPNNRFGNCIARMGLQGPITSKTTPKKAVRKGIDLRVDSLGVMRCVPKRNQAIGPRRDLFGWVLLNQTLTEFSLEEPHEPGFGDKKLT